MVQKDKNFTWNPTVLGLALHRLPLLPHNPPPLTLALLPLPLRMFFIISNSVNSFEWLCVSCDTCTVVVCHQWLPLCFTSAHSGIKRVYEMCKLCLIKKKNMFVIINYKANKIRNTLKKANTREEHKRVSEMQVMSALAVQWSCYSL